MNQRAAHTEQPRVAIKITRRTIRPTNSAAPMPSRSVQTARLPIGGGGAPRMLGLRILFRSPPSAARASGGELRGREDALVADILPLRPGATAGRGDLSAPGPGDA